LKFFVKDPIEWAGFAEAPFYNTLLHLRKSNSALSADAAYKRIVTANDNAIFAYIRQNGKHKVMVVLNLSNQPQQFTISDKITYGNATNVFTKLTENIKENQVYTLSPWGYAVYDYNWKY
jgi:glycosidase